jgi:hypothetical protein
LRFLKSFFFGMKVELQKQNRGKGGVFEKKKKKERRKM